jgi:hypothetical protein
MCQPRLWPLGWYHLVCLASPNWSAGHTCRQLHDLKLATIYWDIFCISSTLTMGIFAYMYEYSTRWYKGTHRGFRRMYLDQSQHSRGHCLVDSRFDKLDDLFPKIEKAHLYAHSSSCSPQFFVIPHMVDLLATYFGRNLDTALCT